MVTSINSISEKYLAMPALQHKENSFQLTVPPPPQLDDHAEMRLNPATPEEKAATRQQLVQAGQQFEAYFISHLMKVMRDTVPQGALSNKQSSYFHSFYDQEIGVRAAESGGIGITQMVQEYADKNFSGSSAQPSSFPAENR